MPSYQCTDAKSIISFRLNKLSGNQNTRTNNYNSVLSKTESQTKNCKTDIKFNLDKQKIKTASRLQNLLITNCLSPETEESIK